MFFIVNVCILAIIIDDVIAKNLTLSKVAKN